MARISMMTDTITNAARIAGTRFSCSHNIGFTVMSARKTAMRKGRHENDLRHLHPVNDDDNARGHHNGAALLLYRVAH